MFNVDVLGIDGRTLDLVCRDPENPHCVSDELLRWNFKQCVCEHEVPVSRYSSMISLLGRI